MTIMKRVVLPKNVLPVKYHITLAPDLAQWTFRGDQTVDVDIVNATLEIPINASELDIQEAWIVLGDGKRKDVIDLRYDEEKETVTLVFAETLPKGSGQLGMRFTGTLNDRLVGFYRSTYLGSDGLEHRMASTQFEATDARLAFPCWDEPAVKAVFEISLIVPSHYAAVSNSPVIKEEPSGDNSKRLYFAETPPMSTYLIAFIVGELEYLEGKARDGTLVRIWTTIGKKEQAQFALDVATRLLPYYNDYFGVPYPLEKLDHLAIPDFAAGAMENWGAITYRETALLFDPKNSSPGTRQRITEVIAHEMAHMWFGDLVTMEWWNDLWLNESFASWMAAKAMDHLFPEWDVWTQFVGDDVNAGLSLDGLENSHPIEANVVDPSQIRQLFDAISYSKGAALIRMLEQFIGPEQFRRGLSDYMSRHSYNNATTKDLWDAMSRASEKPIGNIMSTWTRQTGYPVLIADIDRGAQDVHVKLTQHRFLYTGLSEDPNLWQVPVSLSSAKQSDSEAQLMDRRTQSFKLKRPDGFSEHDWVKINPKHTGFYRVQYSSDELAKLASAVQSLELTAVDRLGLQNDAFALSQACLIPASQFLSLAKAYVNEVDYSVWADLSAGLRRIGHLIAQEPYFNEYLRFGRQIMSTIVKKVGWVPSRGEGHLGALLRSTVLGQMGMLEDKATLDMAKTRFDAFLQEPTSLPPELRGVVYSLASLAGDESTHESLRRIAQESDLQEERVRLHAAMAQSKDSLLLEKTLKMALSTEVRSQDTVGVVTAVAANPYNGLNLAWQFVEDNWAEMFRRYGGGGFGIMRLVSLAGNFASIKARDEIEDFFQRNPVPSASRTVQQSLERIELNHRWLEWNREDLDKWFSSPA